MKKRIFYVINLDRSRIWILGTLLVSTLLFAFATGFRVGAARSSEHADGSLTSGALSAGELERLDLAMSPAELEPNPEAENPDADTEAGDLATTTETDRNDSDAARDGMGARSDASSPHFQRLRDYPSASTTYSQASPSDSSGNSAAREKSSPEKKTKLASAGHSAQKKSAAASSSKKTAVALKDKSSNKKEKREDSNAKSTAERRSNAGAGNPRSALLDTSGGQLRMSNISKEGPDRRETRAATAQQVEENATPANRKSYSLQIAAFRSEAAAKRMAGTLEKQGFHPYIVKSKKTYTVRVGKSDSAKGLWQLEAGLRAKNYAPMRVAH